MITTNKSIEIPKDNIFEHDLLDRKETIKDLSHLITSDIQSSVLSVNADWGTGKTTFIKLWQAYLTERKVKSIYFSAWEDDFTSDPLIAILGELNTYIKKHNSNLQDKFKEAKKMGGKITRKALPAVLKGMVGKIVGDEAVAQVANAFIEESAIALIDNYQEEKETLEKFKNSIAEILKEIDKEKSFIVFIDELDRCRPLYAIECLERIKHIFGIERLVFVLSIDKKNLSESIKSQYGNIDTDNYLRRFIDLEFDLKNPSIDKFCEALYTKFKLNDILKSKEINIHKQNKWNNYLFAMKILVVGFSLSLRQVEQIFTKLQIIFKTTERRLFVAHFLVLVLFEALKSYDNNLYFGLINGKTEAKREIKFLVDSIKGKDFQGSELEDFKIYTSVIIDATALSNDELDALIQQKNDVNSQEQQDLSRYIYFLNDPLGIGGYMESREYRCNQMTKTVIKKIDFSDKFNFD